MTTDTPSTAADIAEKMRQTIADAASAPPGVPLGKATIDRTKLQENLDAGMSVAAAREAARIGPQPAAAHLGSTVGVITGAPAPLTDAAAALRRNVASLGDDLYRAASDSEGSPIGELLATARRRLGLVEAEMAGALEAPVCVAQWLESEEPLPPCHIPGLFEGGDRVCLVAQAKGRKSYLVIQLGLAVASGTPFLYFPAGVPRKVLLVNFENKSSRYQRRVRRMADSLELPRAETANLHIWNADRQAPGVSLWTAIQRQADAVAAEVIIVDPLYRTFEGDESNPIVVKQIVAAMTSITAAGRALIYVHHAPKGRAGDRQTIDRGSGSGIWIRDVSTLISVVEHQLDGLLVCETVTRDYPPRPAETIRFDDEAGCFRHVPGQVAQIQTTASAAKAKAPVPGLERVADLAAEPLLYRDLLDAIRERLAVSKHVAERTIRDAVAAGVLQVRQARGRRGTYYGRSGSFVGRRDCPWSMPDEASTAPIVPHHPGTPQDDRGISITPNHPAPPVRGRGGVMT